MTTFVALDVSLEKTAICIMSADGSIVAEVVRERTQGGLSAARARGRAGGRPAALSRDKRRLVVQSSTRPAPSAWPGSAPP